MKTQESTKFCSSCKGTGWVLGANGYKKCSCAEMDYIKRLWENYGVKADEVKSVSEYKPYDNLTRVFKQKAIYYIDNFEQISGSLENSFGAFGQSGAGKSHVVISIGSALVKRKIPVVYMPYLEIIRELKANSMNEEYYSALSNRYKRAKVLVIDDLYKDKVKNNELVGKLTEVDMKHIYPILNFRYTNKLPTIFSTECTPEMLINLDEALAGRILESCGDFITTFQGPEFNYRLRKYRK